MDRRSVHFTYQPTLRPSYYLRCFFLVLLLLLLVLLLFRASLRARCKKRTRQQTRERASATVTERIIFSATDAAPSRASQGLPLFCEYIWKAWKSIQARILAIVSCYVNNATHEPMHVIRLTFSKSCSVHFLFSMYFVFSFHNS